LPKNDVVCAAGYKFGFLKKMPIRVRSAKKLSCMTPAKKKIHVRCDNLQQSDCLGVFSQKKKKFEKVQ